MALGTSLVQVEPAQLVAGRWLLVADPTPLRSGDFVADSIKMIIIKKQFCNQVTLPSSEGERTFHMRCVYA
jgi:hypothetical protein